MALSSEQCIACTKESKPLSKQEILILVLQLSHWRLREDDAAITLHLTFKNFAESLDFVNKIGKIAEKERHHPDIRFGWGYADISLQTHSIGGLHRNDFIMAAKIEELLRNG